MNFRSTGVSDSAATISLRILVQTGFAVHSPVHALAAYLRLFYSRRLCLADVESDAVWRWRHHNRSHRLAGHTDHQACRAVGALHPALGGAGEAQNPLVATGYSWRALRMDPGNYITHYLLRQAYHATRRAQDASREFEKSEQLRFGPVSASASTQVRSQSSSEAKPSKLHSLRVFSSSSDQELPALPSCSCRSRGCLNPLCGKTGERICRLGRAQA
jgi:hypothetical protein